MELNKKIKAICFDYDGTLVDFDNKMSFLTKTCLRKLKDNNYRLALVSGRPAISVYNIVSKHIEPTVFDYYFGNNAIEFLDYKNDIHQLYKYFNNDDIKRIAKIFEHKDIMIVVYQGSNFLYNHLFDGCDIDSITSSSNMIPVKVDFNDLNISSPKVVLFTNPSIKEEIDKFIFNIKDSSFDLYRSSDMITEVVPKGCGKNLAVDKLCDILSIKKDEIMAAGDNDNDVFMLRECVGLAVGHNKENVVNASQFQCDDVNNDGLYHFFKNNNFID